MKKLSAIELSKIQSSWMLDGDNLVWARDANGGKKAGDLVGRSIRKSGHENVFLTIDGKLKGFVLARIIWFLRTGEYPELEVEHKDCNPQNNSESNLRLASRSQNMANTMIGRTGNHKKGVYMDKRTGKYYVQVQCEKKVHSLCGFSSFDDAYAARTKLAQSLFGEFAR